MNILITVTLVTLALAPLARADTPATLTVTSASYATGGHFLLSGTSSDADGLKKILVNVPNGTSQATLNTATGDWSVDALGLVSARGTYTVTIRVYDVNNAVTLFTTTVVVNGVYAVIEDATVTTTISASGSLSVHVTQSGTDLPTVDYSYTLTPPNPVFADVASIALPHLADGTVSISAAADGVYAVAVQTPGLSPLLSAQFPGCLAAVTAGTTTCGYNQPSSQVATINQVWAQAGPESVHVVIDGYLL